MLLGLSWGEWASIITIIVFMAGMVSLLFKYVIFGRAFNVKKACEECRMLRLKTDNFIKSGAAYEDLVSDD